MGFVSNRMSRGLSIIMLMLLMAVFGLVVAFTAPSARALNSSTINITAPASAEAQTPVTISAQVPGATSGFSYKFVYTNAGWKDWGVIQGPSASTTCTWTPTASGAYTIYVSVIDASGVEVFNTFDINITPQNYSLGDFSVPKSGNVGSTVSLDMAVSGNTAGLQYKFVYEKNWWNMWGVVDGTPSTSPSVSWVPEEPGDYTIYCNICDSSGNDTMLTKRITVGSSFTPGSITVQTSNPRVGDKVKLSSSVSSGDTSGMRYKFVYEKDGWATWGVVNGGPSSSSTVDWVPESPGKYTIYCDMIDAFGNIQTVTTPVTVAVEQYSFTSLRASSTTGQAGGAPITFTADTSGTNQYLKYKFVVEKNGWATWYVAQEPSSSNVFSWTPSGAGNWTVYCDVIDSSGNTLTRTVSNVNITVESYSVDSLSVTGDTVQKLGGATALTVNTSGTNQYLTYKFVWEKNGWSSWGVAQMGPSNFFSFSPSEPGNYTLYVSVIDTAGHDQILTHEVTYWNYQGVNLGFSGNDFIITPDLGARVEGFTYKYVVEKNGWSEWAVVSGGPTSATSCLYAFDPNDRSTYGFWVDVWDPDGNYVGCISKHFAITGTYYNVSLSDLATMEYYADSYGYSDWSGYYNALNPASYSPGLDAYYQFARIDGGTHFCTASQINDFIASTSTGRRGNLQGMGIVFIDAARANNINADYLVCHAILESGWGTSTLAGGYYYGGGWIDGRWYSGGTYYNFFGIGAYDSSPLSGGRKKAILEGWNSRDAAIYGAAAWISREYINSYRHQNTLYLMKWDLYDAERSGSVYKQYCTGTTWQVQIANLMGNMFAREGVTPYYAYDVPCFRP